MNPSPEMLPYVVDLISISHPCGQTSRVCDSLPVMKSGCVGGHVFAPWPETGKVFSPEMPLYSKF